MLRETLISFGATEDTLVYFNAFGEEKHFPCWSKKEDEQINDAYEGSMEIEEGDKSSVGIISVSEATNTTMPEVVVEEKPYSEQDFKDALDSF